MSPLMPRVLLPGVPWHRARVGRLALDLAACLALSAVMIASALAQGVSALPRLELNRLEPQGENCRAYFLIDNGGGEAFRALRLDLFVLDTDGVAQKRFALEAGPVPEKKTLFRLVDVPGLACGRIGRVLLNDVLACEAAAGPRADCAALIETRARGAVPFVK